MSHQALKCFNYRLLRFSLTMPSAFGRGGCWSYRDSATKRTLEMSYSIFLVAQKKWVFAQGQRIQTQMLLLSQGSI